MTINSILKIIRAKKLGVLIRDAREKSGKSLEECAKAMGLTSEELSAVEFGERPPTLPELEIFAYFLDVPLDHFWENEVLKTVGSDRLVDPEEIIKLRQKAIGDLINEERMKGGQSIEELAQEAGLTTEGLQSYEQGEVPIPLPDLEILAGVLNNSVKEFEDHQGPAGNWFAEKRNINEFLDLSQELKEFVGKPINRPYLEMAVRLSELKAERLRALAEGLLEITL